MPKAKPDTEFLQDVFFPIRAAVEPELWCHALEEKAFWTPADWGAHHDEAHEVLTSSGGALVGGKADDAESDRYVEEQHQDQTLRQLLNDIAIVHEMARRGAARG
eukprot:GSA120T00015269001.1